MGVMLLVALVAISSDNGAGSQQSFAPVSVCDVISHDPTTLNGKVIKVRGFLTGTDEGTWLSEECKTHLVTKGLIWGNALSVYVDASDESISRSWERMLEKLKKLHADTDRDKILVTIIGRLETRASMDDEVVEMPYGFVKAGFGHMGSSPAEINVISVEDITVDRRLANKPNK